MTIPRSGHSAEPPSYYVPPTPTIAYLYSLAKNGPKLGLGRTRKLLEELECGGGPPRIVTVAGTNGKGSTARYLESYLRSKGLVTGLFTSPHLLRVNERMCVDGRPITDEALEELIERVRGFSQGDPVTYFEALLGIGVRHFLDRNVEWGVFEVGLGGRLDSTNALEPDVSVISGIGLDHLALLGPTERHILFEKLGIARSGKPLVTGELSSELSAEVERFAAENRVPLLLAGRDWSWGWTGSFDDGEPGEEGWVRLPGGSRRTVRVRGLGDFRVHNAALALVALDALGLLRKGETAVILDEPIPGRMELIRRRPDVFVDVGHNGPALEMLARNLARRPRDRNRIVFGIMRDKRIEKAVPALLRAVSRVVLTAPPFERAADPGELLESFARANDPEFPARLEVADDPARALDLCLRDMQPADTLLVAGSHYMVAEAYLYFGRAQARPIRQEM